MKLAKLSLAAIVALGVSAFADVENVKFSGDAKLYYATMDNDNANPTADLFDQSSSAGQAALDLAVTADLADGVKGKLAFTILSTLGLENNLVANVWEGGSVNTQWWATEAWIAKTFGNTTVKVGRQELDTPLAFTEKWSIAENTFDAAVVLNKDIPQTTLVAAWVGRGNGTEAWNGTAVTYPLGVTPYAAVVRNADTGTDPFKTYGVEGAYAFGAITQAIPMTTAQVWYYDIAQVATAWWLQADVDLKDVAAGVTFGVQYGYIDPDAAGAQETSGWAVKVGYAMDNLSVNLAYSDTDDQGVVSLANTATGTGYSKLYTEAWWNYGYVSAVDTSAWMLNADYKMEGIADFFAQYTSSSNDTTNVDMSEFTVTASKSFGNLDATLAYIYTDADDQNAGDGYNTVQVYLTYNF